MQSGMTRVERIKTAVLSDDSGSMLMTLLDAGGGDIVLESWHPSLPPWRFAALKRWPSARVLFTLAPGHAHAST